MEPIRVLLVDDEPDFLAIVAKRLQKRDLQVSLAGSGEDALAHLEDNPVDVVVLDVKMPGMDGVQTLREIKAEQPHVEVIMLTGHADVEVAVQGMELGAFDYLLKPMDIDELHFKIQDAHRKRFWGAAGDQARHDSRAE